MLTKKILMSMKLLKGKVLIQVFDERNKTKSGILMPVTDNNPLIPDRGIIVNVNKESESLQVGDKVLFVRYQGHKFQDDELNKYLLMDEKYVLVKLDEDADVSIRQGQFGYTPLEYK